MSLPQHNEEMIFKAAIKIGPSAERVAFLRQACGADGDLLTRLEALLRAHDDAGDFLETPPFGVDIAPELSPVAEGPGTVIGRYKLLEKIGEGGMAVVYMAEQTEPLRRKVALKIIKLGMDTRQVIARFEAERQALALMDHPSIARVFDAGSTETGRPYFVMELVAGVSITEYCDKNNLSTKDRLTLFLQVCNAVQHAHQKGIIHRDIKPSNVMVTHHDGKPVPKVIDFGIAKATDQRLTEKTLFTRYAHIIGTPAYMSPEQAELSDLDIDTRSDIYSLGVLLYELLAGTTPFSEEDLRKAGYLEMQRVIREQEPVKPSTKLSTVGETLNDIAKRRNCTPDLLRKAVRGDLDWIAMKCLEKDRVRRYETASGLAEDIRRHLESEPVLARGPSTTYRLRKFLRRHRVQVLVGLIVAALIAVVVVILSIWNQDRLQWNQDRLQLAEAERLQHKDLLDQARDQYAKAERDAALKTIQPILQSPHVGPEAQLLQAGILVDNRHPDEATTILQNLLGERREIAGAAHALLARILWESETLDTAKLKQIGEHRQKAEALLPETAEAHFLRAMTALTIREQLAALDKALQLDPGHYESRRLRAYTFYASRKYERMKDDALVMTILRPQDALGYSLRAMALRDLGKYAQAVTEYDSALARTAQEERQYLDLISQRSEILLRTGHYERVLAEAQAYLSRVEAGDSSPLQYQVFCALIALGDYDKATALFRQIIAPGEEARGRLRDWCVRYVFDTREAGRSWHPPSQEPAGAAFLPLLEAEETYRILSANARCVIKDSFSAQWSPDGSKLAFSAGVHGYSGVAIFDLATKETDLLIVPGKNPTWSPDGRCLAFVRDCQFLRVSEFLTADRRSQDRTVINEEVWVMKADGTEPRRLARGGWPSWSKDSTHIYYHSRQDWALYSVSIEGGDAEPKRIMACPSAFPSVSPDGRRVAYLIGESLRVMDLATQTSIAQWRAPSSAWGGPAWSPAGDELCLGGSAAGENRTGLWVYRLDRNEPAKVLDGQITAAAWMPDGTKLIFGLGAYFQMWAADLDPGVSAIESMGHSQTLGEHFRDMVAFYTRRIEADARDAPAYASRARCYGYLHDREKANTDMRWWSAIMNGRAPSDFWFDTSRGFRRAINLPFDCELVFSAERPVSAIPTMSIAFGQKGRCEMKLLEIPTLAMSLLGLGLLTGFDTPAAYADFTIGERTDLRTAIPVLDNVLGWPDCFSSDGLEMYVESQPAAGSGNFDLWVSRRATTSHNWGPLENLGPAVNSPSGDESASISADGLTLYFDSWRPGFGSADLYVTTRVARDSAWGPAVNMGAKINSARYEGCPRISPDGLELYFVSPRSGGYGYWDIYVTRRTTQNEPWGEPVNLGPTVNSPYWEGYLCLSPDGLLLLFSDNGDPLRPGGYGGCDVWMTRRTSVSSPWQAPVNLGPKVNGSAYDVPTCMSFDGLTLYGDTDAPGNTWQVPIRPVVDFNGDGKVDEKDLALLLADWGKSNSVCDIGPFAWGDGTVDAQDIAVLGKHMDVRGPVVVHWPRAHAVDVPRDVVLHWTPGDFAQTHDVYFGTSLLAVSGADRAKPLGVLVSQSQDPNTYDPPGLLEFGRTYYWRIDAVGPAPAFTVYRGPVLEFATEIYPIQNVTATASSSQPSMGPERTVDGSGLDKNNGHSTSGSDMWLSQGTQPNWIQYQFDKVYALHELWVWNSNQLIESFLGFGARTVKIEYSTDGAKWTPLANVPEFARAPGKPDYVHNTTVSFSGVSAKYVKLTIEKGWGTTPSVGLSEVRFFYIPDRSAAKP